MSITFRPAIRDGTPVLIALAGPSGGGKTFTALRLATGLAGGGIIAAIDTESGRMKHYADRFQFQRSGLVAPFKPSAYVEAVEAAEKLGAKVIVVDSMSHEWSGYGGVLDWHEEELQRMAGDDYKRREAVKFAAWIKPKGAHKKMMGRLLQCSAHMIFCLRAEEKIKMEKIVDPKDGREKMVPVPIGWQPICEKNFMFEMTASFLLLNDAPGVPKPLKLQEQHAPFFPLDRPIDEKAGTALAAWSMGGAQQPVVKPPTPSPADPLLDLRIDPDTGEVADNGSGAVVQAIKDRLDLCASADGVAALMREDTIIKTLPPDALADVTAYGRAVFKRLKGTSA